MHVFDGNAHRGRAGRVASCADGPHDFRDLRLRRIIVHLRCLRSEIHRGRLDPRYCPNGLFDRWRAVRTGHSANAQGDGLVPVGRTFGGPVGSWGFCPHVHELSPRNTFAAGPFMGPGLKRPDRQDVSWARRTGRQRTERGGRNAASGLVSAKPVWLGKAAT
jgi:hypothetical protein